MDKIIAELVARSANAQSVRDKFPVGSPMANYATGSLDAYATALHLLRLESEEN
jgi:hypothetical protein